MSPTGTETGTGPRNTGDGTQGPGISSARREVPVGRRFLLCQALLGSLSVFRKNFEIRPIRCQSLCARNDEHEATYHHDCDHQIDQRLNDNTCPH